MSIRALVLYARHGGQPHFQWPFTVSVLPNWAVITINIAFYAYLLSFGVAFFRIARGAERIVVAGWIAGLLGPLTTVFPPAGGAALRYFQTAAMAAAFLAALSLIRKPYRQAEGRETKRLKRGLLVLGIVIGFMLLLGTALYFVP